ncbi:MAG TPA: hypothetical protein VHM91_11800 [Verrucomicrobiales bacterium]|jgi:hypothetical protein|nr:hypothetical protein [Verrucomicrobiales bacterium]
MLHLWAVGAAMTLVWKYWPGPASVPEASLIEPGSGGASGSMTPQKPRLRMAARSSERSWKNIVSQMPSAFSLSAERASSRGSEAIFLADIQGSGWNSGHGSGLFDGMGEGWGPGSAAGYSAFSRCCSPRSKPKVKPDAALTNAVIVLDLSGSVREKAALRDAIRRELATGLSRLSAGTLFNVVCFGSQAASFRKASVRATPETTAAATAFVEKLLSDPGPLSGTPASDHGGGTSRLDAGLLASFQNHPDEIVVISDGGAVVREGNRSLSRHEIFARIRGGLPEDGTAPTIHTVSLNPAGSGFLRQLAEDFEGEYRK